MPRLKLRNDCISWALFSFIGEVAKKLAVEYLCSKVYSIEACSYEMELKISSNFKRQQKY